MKEIKEIKTAVNSLNNKVMLLYAVVIVAPGVLFALYRLLMAVK